jgi:hypothetical protein
VLYEWAYRTSLWSYMQPSFHEESTPAQILCGGTLPLEDEYACFSV